MYFEKKTSIRFLKRANFCCLYTVLLHRQNQKVSRQIKNGDTEKDSWMALYILSNPAYGYHTDTVGLLILEQEKAAVVRFYIRGISGGKGTWLIAKSLNEQGIPTKTGKATGYRLPYIKILKNPVYTGDLLLQKHTVKIPCRFAEEKNQGEYRQVLIENDHEPIVTHEEYELVQTMMAQKIHCSDRKKSKENRQKNPNLRQK